MDHVSYRIRITIHSQKYLSLRFDLSQILSQSHSSDYLNFKSNLDLSIFENSRVQTIIKHKAESD